MFIIIYTRISMLAEREEEVKKILERLNFYLKPRIVDILTKRDIMIEENKDHALSINRLCDRFESLLLMFTEQEVIDTVLCYNPGPYSWIMNTTFDALVKQNNFMTDGWKHHLTKPGYFKPYRMYRPPNGRFTNE